MKDFYHRRISSSRIRRNYDRHVRIARWLRRLAGLVFVWLCASVVCGQEHDELLAQIAGRLVSSGVIDTNVYLWRLGNGTNDMSGNQNNGVNTGVTFANITNSLGNVELAGVYDGSSWLFLTSNSVPLSSFTLGAYVKCTNRSHNVIEGLGSPLASSIFQFGIWGDTQPTYPIAINISPTALFWGSAPFSTNQWLSCIFVYDGGIGYLYTNNVLSGSGALNLSADNSVVSVGTRPDKGASTWNWQGAIYSPFGMAGVMSDKIGRASCRERVY
jgi:hypothetical protein